MYRFKFGLSSAPGSTQTKRYGSGNDITGFLEVCRILLAVSGISETLRNSSDKLDAQYGFADFCAGKKVFGDHLRRRCHRVCGDYAECGRYDRGLEAQPSGAAARPAVQAGVLADGILEAVQAGTPLLVIPQTDALSDGVAKQLAAAGAFTYSGNVGDVRAPWMGNWYFVRKHPVFDGLPVDQAMGIHYQAKGQAANGLVIERAPGGAEVEIVAAYSRDHWRVIGAGTFTTKLGAGKIRIIACRRCSR